MSAPILATKLYMPAPRSRVVPRPRLIERLDEGWTASSPSSRPPPAWARPRWSANGSRLQVPRPLGDGPGVRAAWLSLDEGDSDPTRFLTYLMPRCRRSLRPWDRALATLHAPQPPPPEAILTALLNDIAALPGRLILVLDDYHAVDAPAVDQALAFLLQNLPPQMHLVIATREDPPLPLARLRARGQLTELRAADLRFTPAEAAEFLNQVMGLNLSLAEIAALEARTEGWIAGLHLAALSMQGREDTAASSRPSAAATVSCWTTWWRKSCNSRPKVSRLFCCAHPSSTACAVPCVMPSTHPLCFRARNPGISRTCQPVHRPPGQRAALVPLSPSLC